MPGPNVYRRADSAIYWCSFTLAGRSVRLSTGKRAESEASVEAARLYYEHHARARLPLPASSERPDLVTICDLYLDDLERRIAAREVVRHGKYLADATSILDRVTERWSDVAEVAPGWARACAEWHADVSWRRLQVVTVFTRAMLRWATDAGHLDVMPELVAPHAEKVATEARERRPFTEQERDRFLRAVRKLDARAWRIYTVLFKTAARKSDLERMTLRQIDFRTGFVTLPARQTKSKARNQVLFLNAAALAAVRAEVRLAKVTDPGAPVFGEFDLTKVYRAALDAARIADRDGLTAHHVTRHTAATMAGASGATLAEMMAFGRWATPQMVVRYMKVSAAQAKAVAEGL